MVTRAGKRKIEAVPPKQSDARAVEMDVPELCDFPGCRHQVFIFCPVLNCNLCDTHKNAQPSDLRSAAAAVDKDDNEEDDDDEDGQENAEEDEEEDSEKNDPLYKPRNPRSDDGDSESVVSSKEGSDLDVADEQRRFLSKFCTPLPSVRARARKVRSKAPSCGKKKTHTSKTRTDPVKVSVWDRLHELGSQGPLIVSAGALMCECCQTILSLKKSTIMNHLRGSTHSLKLEAYNEAKRRKEKFQRLVVPSSTSPPTNQSIVVASTSAKTASLRALELHRYEVAYATLAEGLPFAMFGRVDGAMRRLLEVGRGNLPLRDISDIVPQIRDQEVMKVVEAITAAPAISIAFDTTTEKDELFALVVRFVTKDMRIEHRWLSFKMLSKALTGADTCALLIQLICTSAGVALDKVHYATRDGAPVNGAAMGLITPLVPRLVDFICLSHSINVAGRRFSEACIFADHVIHKWGDLGGNSHLLRTSFKAVSGETFEFISLVRWFCWREVGAQIYRCWDAVLAVLQNENIGSPLLRAQLLQYLQENRVVVLLELALAFDVAKPFAEACYVLEADGFVAPFAYDTLNSLAKMGEDLAADANPLVPSVRLVAEQEFEMAAEQDQAVNDTVAKAWGMYDKLRYDLLHRLGGNYVAYRGLRLFEPTFVAANLLVGLEQEMEFLATLPFVADHAAALAAELPLYHATAVQDGDPQLTLRDGAADVAWAFWQRNSLRLPAWTRCACEVALVMTSSASVERVFSLYSTLLKDNQEQALEDRRECSVLLRYNLAKAKK